METLRSNLRVVLTSPRNPLNIGAAARAMHSFGFGQLRVVNPYEVAFREARSAVAAGEVLQCATEFTSVAEAVADCGLVVGTTSVGHRELQHPLYRLESGASLIRSQAATGPVALLFGSEKFGLSNDDLSHCHWLLRIATVELHESMNLGQAVAVCLYELVREPGTGLIPTGRRGSSSAEPATSAQTEQITKLLLEALGRSGYIQPPVAGSAENKLRRLVRRLNVSARDAPALTGMVRQILWKLSQSEE